MKFRIIIIVTVPLLIASCGEEKTNEKAETIEEEPAATMIPDPVVENRKWLILPALPKTGKTLNDFIPEGWELLDSVEGKLNKDAFSDIAFVLQHKDSALFVRTDQSGYRDTLFTKARIIGVLSGNTNGYRLSVQNNNFIPTHDGTWIIEPFESMSIKKNVLQFDFQYFYTMGSWSIDSYSYKFREQNGQFILIGSDVSSFMRNSHDYDKYSYNFLTKKINSKTGNDNEPENNTSEWKSMMNQSVITLDSIPFLFVYNGKLWNEKDFLEPGQTEFNGENLFLHLQFYGIPRKSDSLPLPDISCGSDFKWLNKRIRFDSVTRMYTEHKEYLYTGWLSLLTAIRIKGNKFTINSKNITLTEDSAPEDILSAFPSAVIREGDVIYNGEPKIYIDIWMTGNFDDKWVFEFYEGKLEKIYLEWVRCNDQKP